MAKNSLNLTETLAVSQNQQVTVHCYPLASQILLCCPLRDFGGKQFHYQMSCDLEVTNEKTHCWENISSYITIKFVTVLFSPLHSLPRQSIHQQVNHNPSESTTEMPCHNKVHRSLILLQSLACLLFAFDEQHSKILYE